MISDITQIDKKTLTEKLALELPALRAKMGNSQADMGELIGVLKRLRYLSFLEHIPINCEVFCNKMNCKR